MSTVPAAHGSLTVTRLANRRLVGTPERAAPQAADLRPGMRPRAVAK